MKKTDQTIADKILAHQISVFRFTAGERKKVFALLNQMQRELKLKLVDGLTSYSKSRVQVVLAQCEKAIERFYTDAAGQIDMLEVAKHQAEITADAIATIGLTAALPTENALKAIVNGSVIEGAPSAAWWEKQSQDLAFKFASQVRQGIAQSETVQQIVGRIIGAKGNPGIMEISRRNAAALVHTSVQQVANDSRLATFRENADILKGVKFLATLDAHTSKTCIAHSGAEWDLDGNPIRGNFPFRPPPLHFNCRSVLVPITKTYRELGINIDEIPTGTRASDLGQIPADTTFEGFLNRHDSEYLDNLLGPGRAKLYRDGKITLQDLVDGNGRELTIEELKKIR